MYETYNMMANIAFIVAIIFCIISIVLFVVLKIPTSVGILTGKTAQKTIKAMKEQADKTSDSKRNVLMGGYGVRTTQKIITESLDQDTQILEMQPMSETVVLQEQGPISSDITECRIVTDVVVIHTSEIVK